MFYILHTLKIQPYQSTEIKTALCITKRELLSFLSSCNFLSFLFHFLPLFVYLTLIYLFPLSEYRRYLSHITKLFVGFCREARLHGKLIDNVAEIMLPSEVRSISFCKYNYVYANMYMCVDIYFMYALHCRFLSIAKSPQNLKRGAIKRAFIEVCFRNFQKQRVFSLFRHLLGKIRKT